MAIESSRLATGNTTLLTIPSGKEYAITTIIFCNTYNPNPLDRDEGEANFDLHLINESEIISAGSVNSAIANNNRVINRLNLKAGESYSFNSEKLILSPGDAIAVVASPDQNPGSPTGFTNLSATLSYLEV